MHYLLLKRIINLPMMTSSSSLWHVQAQMTRGFCSGRRVSKTSSAKHQTDLRFLKEENIDISERLT